MVSGMVDIQLLHTWGPMQIHPHGQHIKAGGHAGPGQALSQTRRSETGHGAGKCSHDGEQAGGSPAQQGGTAKAPGERTTADATIKCSRRGASSNIESVVGFTLCCSPGKSPIPGCWCPFRRITRLRWSVAMCEVKPSPTAQMCQCRMRQISSGTNQVHPRSHRGRFVSVGGPNDAPAARVPGTCLLLKPI